MAAFPLRFPVSENIFRLPTLDEMVSLIQGLNQTTGKNTGLYIEPKSPQWHLKQGQDILAQLISALSRRGYPSKNHEAIIQSFDADTLKRAHFEFETSLSLVQLIGQNEWNESSTDFDFLRTAAGLEEVRSYALGIGPFLPQVVETGKGSTGPRVAALTGLAHQSDLFVHAYTLRVEQLPPEMKDFNKALEFLVNESGLDGVFTDYPDKVVKFLAEKKKL